MKKKKLLLPLAVMTLSCGLAAGILTGCGGHKHNFTEWDHDDSGHWQICLEDGEKSEKKNHVFGEDGKCECGVEKPKYGTASGQVKLWKMGQFVTDYAGVTLDTGEDDGTEIDFDTATGEFEITNARVGKSYTLTISKTGYLPYTTTLEVVEDENSVIGGSTGCVLNYEVFNSFLTDWDHASHSYAHANDAESYIDFATGGTFNPVTQDSYTEVAATLRVDWNNSTNNLHTQGIALIFANGKHAVVRYHNGDGNGNIQFADNAWDYKSDASVFKDSGLLNEWGEYAVHQLSDEERAAITDGDNPGMDLTVSLKGGKLYVSFDGKFVTAYTLPEDVQGQQAKIGYFSWNPKQNAKFYFDISQDIPSYPSTVELKKNVPDGATEVEIALDKGTYSLGDDVTLSVSLPAKGYIVSAITLNGKSILSSLQDGKLTFMALQEENELVVTVVERKYADVDVSVTGKKYDVTGNSIVNGTTVTLKGQGGLADVTFEVANGRIAKTQVVQGTYTAQITGYKSVENVVVGENGIETALVFEYEDAFDLVQGWGKKNLDQQNDGYLKGSNETESLLTKALYRDVAFTVYLSGAYSDNKIDGGNQGIAFRFDGGGYVLVRMEGKQKIQFARPETWWQKDDAAEGADWNDLIFFQSGDKYLKAYAEGTLKLTVVRRGVMFYAFLNDEYIGCQKVADKYAEVGAHVGIYWTGTTNGAYKSWKYEMSETLPSLASTVELTKEIPQGVDGIEITLDKTAYTFGDTVTLNIAGLPEEYIVSEITLNGQSIFGRLNEGTLTFPAMKAENTVVVTVVAKTYGNVDATISGKKRGEENDISLNGTKVKLSNDKYTTVKYEIMVGSDKIAMDHLLAGVYTLSAEGYVSQKITIAADGTYSTAITLVYNVFTAESASADLSKLNEGKVTATGNGGLSLVTKESYTDVTAEAVFDLVGDYATTQRRYSVGLAFGDGKVFRVDLDLHEGDRHIVQEPIWDTMMGFNWGVAKEYTLDEVNAFTNVNFKLVRKGDKVTVYVNDQEIKTYTLPEGYATETAQVKFIFDSNGTDGTKGFTFDITVSE